MNRGGFTYELITNGIFRLHKSESQMRCESDREGSEPELQENVYVNKLSVAWELVGHFSNKWDL